MATQALEEPRTAFGRTWKRIRLMGVPVDALTGDEVSDAVIAALDEGKGGWLITPNLDILRQCLKYPELRCYLDEADLLLCDGKSLHFASIVQGTPLPERFTGSSLIYDLTEKAAGRGYKVFFLGGATETQEKAAAEFRRLYPGIELAYYSPPYGFEKTEEGIAEVRRQLEEAQPDLCWVCLGFPKTDHVIDKIHRDFPKTWFAGVGVSLSYVAGEIVRPPEWVSTIGLEWLQRTIQQPRHLFMRFIILAPPMAAVMFRHAIKNRIRSSIKKRLGF